MEELLGFLDDGWELVQQLVNGKLPCANRLKLVVVDCSHAHTSLITPDYPLGLKFI
jgi:hypothetical protein